MPKITIHDIEENQIIEREMTVAEIKQWEKDKEFDNKKFLEEEKKRIDKIALLAKLGITEDEAKLLLS